MTQYFVRISKKTEKRNIDDTTTEMVHEQVIEAKSMRAAKLRARKVFEALPIVEVLKELFGYGKYKWEDEYKRAYCQFHYWNDNNEKVTVNLGISLLRDYYTFGKNNCFSALYDLKSALEHLQKEQQYIYTTKPESVDTHPLHLKAAVKEVEETLELAHRRLSKLTKKYNHYYEILGEGE